MGLQSVIFNKKFFSKNSAEKWLKKKNLKTSYYNKSPFTESKNYLRYRQLPPNAFKKYSNKIIQKGIIYVVGYK